MLVAVVQIFTIMKVPLIKHLLTHSLDCKMCNIHMSLPQLTHHNRSWNRNTLPS